MPPLWSDKSNTSRKCIMSRAVLERRGEEDGRPSQQGVHDSTHTRRGEHFATSRLTFEILILYAPELPQEQRGEKKGGPAAALSSTFLVVVETFAAHSADI